jgi:energy-coupling factor transporter ATP-binding protein EcfA2
MQTNRENSINGLFSEMHRHISLLLSEIPRLIKFQDQNALFDADAKSAFLQLNKLPHRHLEINNKPVIICAFVGPSGSGKSTIFNLLTGLKTPAGGAVRPMTFASTVAIPQEIYDCFDAEAIFPGFNMVELTNPGDLRNRNVPVSQLFKASYPQPDSNFWLCLVDIPDFNTTETTNWNKAEQMIERADSIIYTVFTESYKDQKAYEFLKKCCRFSGSLTYLLTKIDAEAPLESAIAVREDLLEFAGRDPDFAEERSCSNTLHNYLKSANFYFAERKSEVTLSIFRPFANTHLNFADFLFDQKGLQIILSHHLQSIALGISASSKFCDFAETRRKELEAQLKKLSRHLSKAAQKIVGEEFPVFHILAMIRSLLEENRPNLLQRIVRPLAMIGSGIKEVVKSIKTRISNLKKDDFQGEISERNKLERERLAHQVEKLVEKWRDNFDSKTLTAENCRKHIEILLEKKLPPVDDEWELFVRAKLQIWIANNKNRWIWINVINDIIIFLGAGLFVADVFIDGGIGTLGLVAAIGGGSAAGGFLLSLFNNMGLGKEILEAHKLWKELREKSYIKHLNDNLALPLFASPMLDEFSGLDDRRINECRIACKKLEEISRRYEKQKS